MVAASLYGDLDRARDLEVRVLPGVGLEVRHDEAA
jgi:hypothetical protein